jgi:hypothetical protein
MSEMVERVAKAIRAQANGFAVGWEREIDAARAAIAAMREPTSEMEDAADDVSGTSQLAYRAMIDAALEEQP